MSVIVAKIARTDWPDEWPAFFPQLLQAVQEGNGLTRIRALMFMHASIKELSARVVGPTPKQMAEAAPPIFSYLFGLWKEAVEYLNCMFTRLTSECESARVLERVSSWHPRSLRKVIQCSGLRIVSRIYNRLWYRKENETSPDGLH